MGEQAKFSAKGLFSSPNPVSEVPAGALEEAENVIISDAGVVEPRRGFSPYGNDAGSEIRSVLSYQDTLLVHEGTTLHRDTGNGVWASYSGQYYPDDAHQMHAAQSNNNLYFTTAKGTYRLDALAGTPALSGVPRAPDGRAAAGTGSGWLQPGNQVAYQVVFGIKDANGNLHLGAPSPVFLWIHDGAGTTTPAINFTLPDDLTASHFVQVYRSLPSGGVDIAPSTEVQQVGEIFPTAAQIQAREMYYVDDCPIDMMKAAGYWCPSQGDGQGNDRAPISKDVAFFKGAVFAANTTQKQRTTITLLGVGFPNAFGYVETNCNLFQGNTSIIVTNTTVAGQIRMGMRVVGTGIPANTYVLKKTGTNTLELSNASTQNATGRLLEFQDVLKIGNDEFFASYVHDPPTGTIGVPNTYTPAENLAETVGSLIECVNRKATSPVYAISGSSSEDLPGKILFEERGIGAGEYAVTCTAGNSWAPSVASPVTTNDIWEGAATTLFITSHGFVTGDVVKVYGSNTTPSIDGKWPITKIDDHTFTIPVTTTNPGNGKAFVLFAPKALTSTDDAAPNRLHFSKVGIPEAWPLGYYVDVGSKDDAILRIVPLKDSLIIVKEKSIWRLVGDNKNSYSLAMMDDTTKVLGPNTVVNFAGSVYAFSDQGVVSISDGGSPQVLSRPIEGKLLGTARHQDFSRIAWAVASEPDRRYCLFLPTALSDTCATQAFVYNPFVSAWTHWTLSKTCGIFHNDKFYMGDSTGHVYEERKSLTREDYVEDVLTVTVTGVTGTTVTLADASGVVVGDTVRQNVSRARVAAVAGNTVVLDRTLVLVNGPCSVYKPIPTSVVWSPLTGDNPGVMKNWRTVVFTFLTRGFEFVSAAFKTNFSGRFAETALKGPSIGTWGNFDFGAQVWGGELVSEENPGNIKTYVHKTAARGHWLSVGLRTNEAFAYYRLAGIFLQVEGGGDSFGGGKH